MCYQHKEAGFDLGILISVKCYIDIGGDHIDIESFCRFRKM
jgi:hypothetical protein